MLTGRSEGFIVGRPDLKETIRRITAYAEAGADCLYAPGIRSHDDIVAVVKAVAPKPVNVLVGARFRNGRTAREDGRAPHQRRWSHSHARRGLVSSAGRDGDREAGHVASTLARGRAIRRMYIKLSVDINERTYQ